MKLAVAALAIGGGYQAARMLAPARQAAAPWGAAATALPTTVAAPAPDAGQGDQLLQSVLRTIELRPNIAAKVRQTVRSGELQLTGAGAYWQQDRGNQQRTCWQLQTLVGGETAFYKQVYDGDFLWIDRQMSESRSIFRVDVERVRRELAMAESPTALPAANRTKAELLARGGLVQLFAELQRCFTFGAPQALPHGEHTALAIVGQWREEQLALQWPSLLAPGAQWPAHLPHHVAVHVDNDTLFPYFIEYRSGAQAGVLGTPAASQLVDAPLARYEFIDVQFAASMPEHLFQFAPAQLDWQDVTAGVLDRLRPPPAAEQPETAAARHYGSWK